MIKEFKVKGNDYFAIEIDGIWTIRETSTGSEITVTSDENKLEESVLQFLEKEGIRIEGELFTKNEIQEIMQDTLTLRKENAMLKKALHELEESV